MRFVTKKIAKVDAFAISNWKYPSPYDFYDMKGSQEAIDELLNGAYYAVDEAELGLFGFYCVGSCAQVPGMRPDGAYAVEGSYVVDLGLGMRPDLNGQGYGTLFLQHILNDLDLSYPTSDIRLTVAEWNTRAIRVYERHGFRFAGAYLRNADPFQVMRRTRHE